jgi:hypothetical protein
MSARKSKRRGIAPPPDTTTLLVSTAETSPLALADLPPLQPQRLAAWLLVAALVSGIGLMIPTVFAGPLVLDEHGTYWLVGESNPGTLWQRSLDYENIPPLSPWLQRQCCRVFGTSELSLRLLSMVSYWLAILAAYWLGRELLGPLGGGLAALVLAWHPEAVGEIRIARCYGLTLLLATLAFAVTIRWSRRPLGAHWAALWCALNIGLVWTHYLNAAVILAQVVWLAISFNWRSLHVWTLSAMALGGVIAASLPLVKPFFRMAVWGESFNFQSNTSLWSVIVPLWWLGLPVAWLLGRWVSPRSRQPDLSELPPVTWVLLLGLGLLPMLLAVGVCHGDLASLSNPRYRIGFVAPSACLLAACLMHQRSAGVAVLGVLISLTVGWTAHERWPWDLKRLGSPRAIEWKALAEYVGEHGRPDEPLFVQGGLGEGYLLPIMYLDPLFQDYVASRLGRFYLPQEHPRYGLPFLWGKSEDMVDHYEELLADRARSPEASLWVACATDTDLNRMSCQVFQEMLRREGYRPVDELSLPNAILVRYAHEPRP